MIDERIDKISEIDLQSIKIYIDEKMKKEFTLIKSNFKYQNSEMF